MAIGFQSPVFHKGTDQKMEINELVKGKLIGWSLFWFFKGLGITFWTVWTLDE